jgi:hypothetical protein
MHDCFVLKKGPKNAQGAQTVRGIMCIKQSA